MFILIVLAAILSIYLLWSRRHLYILSWKLDGPPAPLPILGNILSMYNENRNTHYVDDICRKYKSPSRVWMGPNLYVLVHDAVAAEIVLRSKVCLDKPNAYKVVREVLDGDGLFTASGDHWRSHRKLMQPSLKDTAVFEHFSYFNLYLRDFCTKQLKELCDQGKPFDVLTPLNVCFLCMYLDATFGVEWKHKSEYASMFGSAIAETSKRLYRPWLEFKIMQKILGYERVVNKFRNFANSVVKQLIQSSIENGSCSSSFIDKLILISQQNNNFSIEDIKVEAHSLLIGASDTTAVGTSSVILLIAMHPRIQEKLYDELTRTIPESDPDAIAPNQINQLTYMDLCIREALRLFPTVPFIGRCPVEPIVLNGKTIPAGFPIFIAIRQIQRKKELWGEDADEFIPERFHREECKNGPGSYIPFSMGPRNCIGYSYAIYTMKLAIAHILRRYQLTSPLQMKDLDIRTSISFRFLTTPLVQLHRRNK